MGALDSCSCGPGPVGGRGWRADCPRHNVRELLKAPPEHDPDTLPERIAAMTGTTTTENPPERTMGLGEVIRANRTYIGISQRGMAKHLNDMDRRSYQRIENGDDPCPPGLLDTVAATTARFDAEVDAVLAAIEKSDDKVVRVGAPTDPRQEWLRCVVGRAYILDEGKHTVELVAVDQS